jgi:hypothetical protein
MHAAATREMYLLESGRRHLQADWGAHQLYNRLGDAPKAMASASLVSRLLLASIDVMDRREPCQRIR